MTDRSSNIGATNSNNNNNNNNRESNSLSASVIGDDKVSDDSNSNRLKNNNNNKTTINNNNTKNVQRITTITTELFIQYLQQYIENEKPDLMQRKQLESWDMIWINDDTDTDNYRNIEGFDDFIQPSTLATNSTTAETSDNTTIYILSGTLQIKTEYMIVYIVTKCYWKGNINNGSIRFTCHVGTQPICTTDTTGNNNKSKQSMIHRLCNDEYIQKILITDDNKKDNNSNNNNNSRSSSNVRDIVLLMNNNTKDDDTFLLGTASIDRVQQQLTVNIDTSCTSQQQPQEMKNEERVYCNERIGEALRRLLYSTSDTSIDILDIIFRFPYLPCTSGNNSNKNTISTTTTQLADRIQLRLLEEITYDACNNLESENEEDIVDELSIGDDDDNNNNNDDNNKSKNNERGLVPKKKKVKR